MDLFGLFQSYDARPPLAPDGRGIFIALIAVYGFSLLVKFLKHLKKEEKLDVDAVYQRTQFMDFPVFSVC